MNISEECKLRKERTKLIEWSAVWALDLKWIKQKKYLGIFLCAIAHGDSDRAWWGELKEKQD